MTAAQTPPKENDVANRVKRYRTRIATARVVIFVIAGLLILGTSLWIYNGLAIYEDSGFILPSLILGALAIIYLFLGLFSLYYITWPLVVAATAHVFSFIYALTFLLSYTNSNDIVLSIVSYAVHFTSVWLIARGAIAAVRSNKLIENKG